MNARTHGSIPLLLAAIAFGQDIPSTGFGGSGGVSVGIRRLDLDKLGSSLRARGFDEPSATFLSIGGGGQFQKGMWLLGGEGGAWIPAFGSAERGDDEVQLAGGWGVARVGIDPVSLGKWHLVPSLGLGGGGLRMRVSHRPSDRFDALLEGPGDVSALDKVGLLVEPAVTMEWRTVLAHDGDGECFLSIGLRAAYAWSPLSSSWTNATGNVHDAPDVDLGGPSLRLLVGVGGRARTR